MDFEEIETEIKTYIEANYSSYLRTGLSVPSEYVDDFLDLDLHKKNNTIFYEFNDYNFDDLSNESNEQTMNFKIYIVCRNGKSSTLKSNCRDYATDFYKFFVDNGSNFGGIGDIGKMKTATFYDAVDGDTGIKIAELQIMLKVEV